MTELQEKEFELLKLFILVCSSLKLRYYLVCGSALGAVKYKGFIPWDDDIDVGMPREDYEVFVSKAQELLPENVFLQNYRTDKSFPHVFTKLRNSDTTLIEENMAHLNMNHGIFIDVFPLDGYPKNKQDARKLKWKKKILNWLQYCALKNTGTLKIVLRNRFFRLLGYHKRTHKTLARLDALISKYKTEDSNIWCNHGNWQGELEYAPRFQYGVGVKADFEGIEVIIPEQFDAYLTQKYGEWRKELPKQKQKSHHSIVVLDTQRSYREYL